jgi:hypothetical protein
MPLRRLLGVLAGVGLFLSPVVIQRAEAPHASAQTRPSAAPATDTQSAAGPFDPLSVSSADIRVRAPLGPLVVATDATRLSVRTRPGGAVTTVPARNPWEQPLAFPVIGRSVDPDGRQWLRVLLGVHPNGAAGWVPADRVHPSPVIERIAVDLSARTLRRWHDGRLVDRLSVGVGASSTPTPPGRFFVWASLDASATGPYGTFVLGLSGYPVDGSQAAGDARLAIHGTDDPTDLGQAVSHGCVRVLNDQLLRLRDVPMGTVVTIRP